MAYNERIKVDVMATKEVGWAPANVWFKPGFNHLQEVKVDGQKIRVLPLSYFLGSYNNINVFYK